MRRQARGARLEGPGEGPWPLPCGRRSGLLCAVLCWPLPALPTPACLLPTAPGAPACAPAGCTALSGGAPTALHPVPWALQQSEMFLPQGPPGTLG